MSFILVNWVKYYTKEAFKTLKVVSIGSAIIVTVAFVKYRPVYKVTLSGEKIGYVEDKDSIERKIDKYLNDTSGNIAYRDIDVMPEYEFKLVSRAEEIREKNVLLAVEDTVTTTYRTFAITQDGEQKTVVSSREDAENIITEMNKELDENIDLKLGIVELYATELTYNPTEEAMQVINEIKTAKVQEYEEAKAKAAAEARARARAQAAARALQIAMVEGEEAAVPTGSINGMALSAPVAGSISSRFGARSSIRSGAHTGLDIACAHGTGIRPASAGTVTFAAYNGSYGNLIKIDHGNGVETWYAHCSEIYVAPGQYVDTGSVIGAVGQTGNATGPHLHLEIRIGGTPVNPQDYLY